MHRFVATQPNTRVALSFCTKAVCASCSSIVAPLRHQSNFAADINQQQQQQQPGQGQPFNNQGNFNTFGKANTNTAAPSRTNANIPYSNANNNNNNNANPNFRNNTPRVPLPPAFDLIHWDDNAMENGYLLRLIYRDSFIVLDYHRQVRRTVDEMFNRAERLVTVTLPPVYIARFLGVLEGRMDKVEVQSRYTNATFGPDPTKDKHHYVLKCVSMRPTTGMQQSADGSDMNEEAIEWTVNFDVAESLMLHRFLSESLKYNSGFARRPSN